MNQRRNRVGQKTTNPTMSPVRPKPTRTTTGIDTAGRSADIQDILQSDNGGMPFILVDSVNSKNRQQLQTALTKIEKKRMRCIQRQCSTLPLLKYTRPATRTEPFSPTEEAIKDELDFQADIHMLCLEMQTEESDEASCPTGAITPIGHSPSAQDLLQNKKRLNEIRKELEKLRHLQQNDISSSSSSAHMPYKVVSEPKLTRQATFEVPREKKKMSPTAYLKNSASSPGCLKSNHSKHNVMRALTIESPVSGARSSLTQIGSTTCLFKNKSYGAQNVDNKSSRKQSSTELPKIINKIGDLLLQLPQQQHEKSKQEPDKGHLSYLVTITPPPAA
ncbi:hypothetical protein KR222_010572, partial [Zaprionus bogoriensis]